MVMLSCTFVVKACFLDSPAFVRQDTSAVEPISPFFGAFQTAFGFRDLDRLQGRDSDGVKMTDSSLVAWSCFDFLMVMSWVMFV